MIYIARLLAVQVEKAYMSVIPPHPSLCDKLKTLQEEPFYVDKRCWRGRERALGCFS